MIGRLDAATGTVDDAVLKDVDTLMPVQEVRPAACEALAVGGVARMVVMLPSDATVVANFPAHIRTTTGSCLLQKMLPRDETSLMLLRANANKPIISVALPSVASAAALAPAVRNLQAKMPQHSWCFFAPSPSPEGIPQLPAAVCLKRARGSQAGQRARPDTSTKEQVGAALRARRLLATLGANRPRRQQQNQTGRASMKVRLMKGSSATLQDVQDEVHTGLELRNVRLELRNVRLELRNVGLERGLRVLHHARSSQTHSDSDDSPPQSTMPLQLQ